MSGQASSKIGYENGAKRGYKNKKKDKRKSYQVVCPPWLAKQVLKALGNRRGKIKNILLEEIIPFFLNSSREFRNSSRIRLTAGDPAFNHPPDCFNRRNIW